MNTHIIVLYNGTKSKSIKKGSLGFVGHSYYLPRFSYQKFLFYKFGYEKKVRVEVKTLQVINPTNYKYSYKQLFKESKNSIVVAPLITNEHILSNKRILSLRILSYALNLHENTLIKYNIKTPWLLLISKHGNYRIKQIASILFNKNIEYLFDLYSKLSKMYNEQVIKSTLTEQYLAKHCFIDKYTTDLNLKLAKIGSTLYNFHRRY